MIERAWSMFIFVSWPWRNLSPHRALRVDETRSGGLYVHQGSRGAREIGTWLTSGLDRPAAMFGPAGTGKSTELAALAGGMLAPEWAVTVLASLDRLVVYRDGVTVEQLAEAVAVHVVMYAREVLHLPLSPELTQLADDLHADREAQPGGRSKGLAGLDLLRAACVEVRNASRQGRLVLLVDGGEKAPLDLALRWFRSLAELRGDVAVVTVAPVQLTTGPSAEPLLADYKLFSVGPVVVDDAVSPVEAHAGLSFLLEVAARRLGIRRWELPINFARVLEIAAARSGGVARSFLQMVQDAATHAAMDGRDEPDLPDLDQAFRGQGEEFRRLLRDGDVDVLLAANGSDGVEVPLERRVRLLAHGILLEHQLTTGPLVRVAPQLLVLIAGTVRPNG